MTTLLNTRWIIFTDGACSGNPGPGGWAAIVSCPKQKVIELGGRESSTTNNRMELMAVIRALQSIDDLNSQIEVYTDSTYLIRGMTQWIWGWKKRNWVTSEGKEVANVDLWKSLSTVTYGRKIEWKYVRGHIGIPGNERSDEIAVQFSKGFSPSLFEGKLEDYPIELHQIPANTDLPEQTKTGPQSKTNNKPFCYLSLIGQEWQRHQTWTDCERRVRGQSGAKFKKAMTPQDEIAILNSWGFSPISHSKK
jgi:ribonuclease HI